MKIAIVGCGISGLSAACLLQQKHDITLYEKESLIGGHSRTIDITTPDGEIAVDTGFIVFNYRNYPNLTGLFEALNVPTSKSHMSFGVTINNGWLEYGTQHLAFMFSQWRNIARPKFWFMLRDIMRFNGGALNFITQFPDASLSDLLEAFRLGDWFREYYLLAMGGAIWSMPIQQMLQFPAKTMVHFFHNHGLLTVNDQPQWHTVTGGSREYLKRLSTSFSSIIRTECAVHKIERLDDARVAVMDIHGDKEIFDHVILACHSDQALQIIDNPSEAEKNILGSINYQPNKVIVHRDTSFMPQRRKAWSSWVYLSEDRKNDSPSMSLTYWMNNLQPLDTQTPVFVTLNPNREPDPSLVYNQHEFSHPVFDLAAIQAQKQLSNIQGQDRLWFCGAWQCHGFHEDGIRSAVEVAQSFGITPSWQK